MWRVGTVVALHNETATARTITLEVPDWPGHVAGQHVDVRLTAADGLSLPKIVFGLWRMSCLRTDRRLKRRVALLESCERISAVHTYVTQ